MPCSLEGSSNSSERTKHTVSNRSAGQNIDHCYSKDQQVRKLVSNNPEERYIIFALLSLEHDSYWKLAPFLPAIQGANKINRLTAGAPSERDSPESLSPEPTIVYWFDQRNEKNINMPDQTDSVKQVSYGSSVGGSALTQPRNRKKFNNSSTAFLPCYVVSDKSSRSVSGSPVACSDILIDDLTKADKTAKLSPKKKGNKKGKRYRRATCKKVNSASEICCEENILAASLVELPQNNLLVKHLAETSSSTGCSVKDVSVNKDDSENNNEYVDCPTVLISCTSGSDSMDDSEPIASSRRTACEGFNCNGVTCLYDGPNAADVSEANGSALREKHGYPCSIEESNSCHKSSCASGCNSNTTTIDSFLDGWNSDISGNCSDDVEAKSTLKDQNICDHLQCAVSTDLNNLKEVCHPRSAHLSENRSEDSNNSFVTVPYCSKDITDGACVGRVQCSSEACSSSRFFPVVSGTRGKGSRKASSYSNLNGSNRVIGAASHNRSGKDSSVSVWQKVEKLDNKESICRAGQASATPLQDKPEDTKRSAKPNQSKRVKQNQRRKARKQTCSDEAVKAGSVNVENDAFSSSGMLSESTYKKQTAVANQKLALASKQTTSQSSKIYYAAKSDLCKVTKNQSQQKGALPSLQLVNVKHTKSGLFSSSVTSNNEVLFTPNEGVSNNLTQENTGSAADISEATRGGCDMGSDLCSETAHEEAGPSSIQQDSHYCLSIGSKPVTVSSGGFANLSRDLCSSEMEDNQGLKSEIESSPLEPSKLDTGAGHTLQKWVPVGKKEIPEKSHLDGSKTSGIETSVLDNDNSNYAKIEVTGNISDVPASTCGCLSSAPVPFGESDALNCQTPMRIETDLNNIRKAVSDAYKAQKAVENFHFVNGRPLADFERLIYCASPIVDHCPCPQSCISSSSQWIGDRLCSCQIHNISLRSIWQWYEEPGCYGLEVKAQDFHKSEGFWNNNYEFTAYFVPYLSAVQLFAQSKSTKPGCSNEKAAKMGRTEQPSSNLSTLPILSKLLPRPSNQRSSSSSFCTQEEQFLRNDDGELIFEYFESEPPPSRRPLFDKIKELVGGVKPSNSRISGDPKNLEHLSLHDLHPDSWYCVAWYPIYRIPDGKFQAAFLTYHSLGHLDHRSSSQNLGGPAHVVSPVVGLQSYNDKGEWWFQMNSSDSDVGASTVSSPHSTPAQVLRERLQTLNRTASVMARACFSKDGQMCRNRHSDYEFFLSRYR